MRTERGTAPGADPDRIERPDVELAADVKAARVRFARKPQVDVDFTGDTEREATSSSERENVPDEVEPGVTYRDVRVRWRAAARIHPRVHDEIERNIDEHQEESR